MRRTPYAAALVLALACATREPAHAQANFFSLEAAYIFNFTDFADWPPSHMHSPRLNVCVSPTGELSAALATLEGRTVDSRSWHVHPLSADSDPSICHVLVVDAATPDTAPFRTALASNAPLLIVRTADAASGPYVIQLELNGNRLRFDVDQSEAVRRHIRLSSKLLRLARSVT